MGSLSLPSIRRPGSALPGTIRAAFASKGSSKPQTCIVPSHNNVNVSDTPAVHAAFKKCGKGGRIVFSENTNYTLRELTTMAPCIGCTVQLEGTIQLSDNITYWLKNETTNTPNITAETFPHLVYYPFQDTVAYLVLKDWHVLLTIDGANNITIDNVAMKNPANWFNWVIDSKNVAYKRIRLSALSTNKNPPANADGWDTYRTSHFELRDSHVVSGDDCFAFKGNSTYITIENVYCQNSHGISVGSLAQYPGILDIVEHVKVKNITFVGNGDSSSNGARIKIWSGPVGSAIVNDIHYEDISVTNVTNPLVVDSCYFSSAYCATGKPVASITNVTVTNVTGTSTGKVVSSIICPEGSTCDIKLKNINIRPRNGDSPIYRCFSVTSEDLGVNCTYPTVVNGAFKWPA
ncbi:hypothetical protein OPQ81_001147 [Rhizoctonia solani]|nr:hypothetical protein OPQ81_001147 [Rhizoctonia solani]